MSRPDVPTPGSRDELFTRWAFNFFMGGLALAVLIALAYVVMM